MGSATALTQFSRSIGATLGVTVMGVIVNHGLPAGVGRREGVALHRLPPDLRDDLANALHPAFFVAALVSLVVFAIAARGVEEVPLQKGFDESSTGDDLGEGAVRTPP